MPRSKPPTRTRSSFPRQKAEDELVVRQAGANVRVQTSGCNCLFVGSRRSGILKTYATFVARARRHFKPRWRGIARQALDADAFLDFTRKATLHAMYFYIVNRKPVKITMADWDHPSVWRLIQTAVESRLPPRSAEAAAVCARLMGMPTERYRRWRIGDDRFLDR